MTTTTVSKKFAHLPNGIIRHIVSYTGATYKKRNGKYMGQIPKDDPRYAILNTIPRGDTAFAPYSDHLPYSYATNYVEFNRNSPKSNCYMFFCVAISTYPNEGREVIGYYHVIQNEITGERRRYTHEVNYIL
jgi:hypothetical protein